ncbi:hypothetical protein [Sutcliffiella horikoshii]|uniref:hypothetical protein n=1 Tax=Sutcliffiella horikoshii TaxID=79883 RepID=UPI001F19EB18|nr:hypothetical protein [Sutcliffiella horikoshii]MCG1021234.1 hypothetical protein [Sutcliffiella horikoshii]
MILLNGISDSGGQDTLVDGNQFKRVCYSIVTNLGGRILSFREPVVAQNYYYAEVSFANEDRLYILINSNYPFIAFTTSPVPFNMTFVDHKQLTVSINQLCGEVYRVLQPDELYEPLRLKEAKGNLVVVNENTLNKWDLYNIKYWQPKTVGDVVFNYWD